MDHSVYFQLAILQPFKKDNPNNQWWGSVYFKKTGSYPYLRRTWFYINFCKIFFSVLKISKTFVFFLRTPYEYSKKYRQESVMSTGPYKRNPCPYLVKYWLDVLKKKTKVLDILNPDKKCFTKINIELSPREICIGIRFLKRIPITANNSI